jgi:hypothetical protein
MVIIKKKILGQLITKEEINNIKQELNSFFQNEFTIKNINFFNSIIF